MAALKAKFVDMTEDALSELLVDFGDQLSILNFNEEGMKTAEHSLNIYFRKRYSKAVKTKKEILFRNLIQ